MNYYDEIKNELINNEVNRRVKNYSINKTVGIIICKKNNQYVIDYCSDSRIIAREYKFV